MIEVMTPSGHLSNINEISSGFSRLIELIEPVDLFFSVSMDLSNTQV